MTTTIATELSIETLSALRAESRRAHLKHYRPNENSGSLFDDKLTLLSRLAALLEEIGEVAEELCKEGMDRQLTVLVRDAILLGKEARSLTYDGGGPSGINGPGIRELPPGVDRDKLITELHQVANVAASWAQQLDTSRWRS